jgi:predicted ester cyclase
MPSDTSGSADDRAIAVMKEAILAVAHGDIDALRRTTHPEAVNREARREPPDTRGRGPEAFLATSRWLRTAYSDIVFTFDHALAEDDLVVTYGTMAGRHTGDFVAYDADGGIERVFPATGRTFTVAHAHFGRLRDGLVIEHWAVRDDLDQAAQLGWIPPSPQYLLRCTAATARARREARRH